MDDKYQEIENPWNDPEFGEQLEMVKILLESISLENQEVINEKIDISKIIDRLEDEHIKQQNVAKRLATVSAESAELFVELEEKTRRLATISDEAAELMVEMELKNDLLNKANKELGRANAHAAELMAEIELKNKRINQLNNALANANAQASELVAEIENQRKEANASKERYEILFNSGNDMIFVYGFSDDSTPGKIIEINDIACQKMGYSREEFLDMTTKDMRDPSNIPDYGETSKQIKEKNHALFERWLMTKDGRSIPVEVNTHFLELLGEKMVMGIARDITEHKKTETILNNLMPELEQSNKDLEIFAYGASHDLQEPLRMISKYAQLLDHRYRGKLDTNADEFIDYIIDGSNRMQKLIDGLLNYSRINTRGKEPKKTDLDVVLNNVLSDLDMMIEDSGAKIEYNNLPFIEADEIQLGQVFQNLVSNAIKFHSDKPPVVKIETEKKGTEWLIKVQDNGVGMDPKFQERAFMLFQREDPYGDAPGTGIGLAVVKRIIERHKGKVWFDSKPGKGTTFYFTIPDMINNTNEGGNTW